ncbi:MAG: L-threonylcarbamoyladenylate synthase [Oscillospiraceae bacterium]
MDTLILEARDPGKDSAAIETAAELLRTGGLVILPTETVYGLGADATNPAAVEGIFRAKGRPQDNPLIVHVAKTEDIVPLVTEVPLRAQKLAEAFWPGPLTMILPRSERIPAVVSAGLETVALRFPSHPIARAVIERAGVPVAAPSANRSGSPSPTNAQHCISDMMGRVDAILDGGPCQVGLESTVVSLVGDKPRLLRPGAVTPAQLREVLGEIEVDSAVLHQLEEGARASSPGMKYRHYAPKAEVLLVHGGGAAYQEYANAHSGDGVWAMAFREDIPFLRLPALSYGGAANPEEQAEHLFSALRELDDKGAKQVLVHAPRPEGVGLAVYNRLLRAASFREYYPESGCF